MAKGNMQLIAVGIIAVVVGILIGRAFAPTPAPQAIDKPGIVNLADKFKEDFPNKKTGFAFDFITKASTGSVEVFKIADRVPLHSHAKENHILYIYQGTAKGNVGDIEADVAAGQLIIIPAGMPHTLQNTGKEPLAFVLFSTPPFDPEDIEMLG